MVAGGRFIDVKIQLGIHLESPAGLTLGLRGAVIAVEGHVVQSDYAHKFPLWLLSQLFSKSSLEQRQVLSYPPKSLFNLLLRLSQTDSDPPLSILSEPAARHERDSGFPENQTAETSGTIPFRDFHPDKVSGR